MFIEIKPFAKRLNSNRMLKKRHCYLFLLVAILLLPLQSAKADDDLFSAFQARYDLFKNDRQIGETILEAEKSDGRIRWQSTTIPSGLLALITSQQPYSESILIRTKGDYRLSSVRISTGIKESPEEIAEFDWQQSLLSARRKSKQVKLPLTGEVYDYLSIHWLAAQMSLADADQYKLTFYRSGKLMRSKLVRTGIESLEIGGKSVEATVYEQSFEGSSRRLTYHYGQKNRWLPLRIQRNRKSKKTIVMLLKSLETTD